MGIHGTTVAAVYYRGGALIGVDTRLMKEMTNEHFYDAYPNSDADDDEETNYLHASEDEYEYGVDQIDSNNPTDDVLEDDIDDSLCNFFATILACNAGEKLTYRAINIVFRYIIGWTIKFNLISTIFILIFTCM
ncbi:hypothetical protein OROGR_019249 [Orobanche gracilis]